MIAHALTQATSTKVLIWLGLGLCILGALRCFGLGTKVPERVGKYSLVIGLVMSMAVGFSSIPRTPSASRITLSSAGSVAFVSPVPETHLNHNTTEVVVDVRDFKLVDPFSQRAQNSPVVVGGEGHVHIARDGLVLVMGSTTSANLCIPEGRHTLTATLVGNDHLGFANFKDLTATTTVTGAEGAHC